MLTNSWEGQPVRLNCHRFTGLLVGTFGIRGLNLGIPPMKFDYYLGVSLELLAPPMNLFEARCCQWSRKFEGCFHFDICFTTIVQLGSNHHLHGEETIRSLLSLNPWCSSRPVPRQGGNRCEWRSWELHWWYWLPGGGFPIFLYFHPYFGKWFNLTSIFFRWVETSN